MLPFSLITESWLPAIDRAGKRIKISPQQLPDGNIIDLAYARPDFQGAAYQFLIGLLQSIYAPEDEDAWDDIFDDGIDAEAWQQALTTIEHAMQFGPDKPSFLQDLSSLEVENSSISGLLVDAPGGNSIKLNKDHFVKRGSYSRICPHCAVMALYSVQTNSPAAGAGFRTSMRGGGPMTTLVLPQNSDAPLWQKLWLNVLPQQQELTRDDLSKIFPWLAPTRTSDAKHSHGIAGGVVTPENSHPLQAYWGMPRRIELDFMQSEEGNCDLCGERNNTLLTQMRNKNYGVQYDGWLHPLSPYKQAAKDTSAPMLALKGQPGGLAYKDWLGLMLGTEDKFNRTIPAKVVRQQVANGNRLGGKIGLWCFGYDMDNAKARCWYEHRLPLFSLAKADTGVLVDLVSLVISLAAGSLLLLRQALKEAWFATPKEAKGDFSFVDIVFWQETEPFFRQLLSNLLPKPQPSRPEVRLALKLWQQKLYEYLFTSFDRQAFTNPEDPQDLLRILKARKSLDKQYNKQKALKDLQPLITNSKEVQNV